MGLVTITIGMESKQNGQFSEMVCPPKGSNGIMMMKKKRNRIKEEPLFSMWDKTV